MPAGAGTHEATSKGVTELAIVVPHCGSVTVQFNPYLVIEHQIIRGVLCVNVARWVGLWKYAPQLLSPPLPADLTASSWS